MFIKKHKQKVCSSTPKTKKTAKSVFSIECYYWTMALLGEEVVNFNYGLITIFLISFTKFLYFEGTNKYRAL